MQRQTCGEILRRCAPQNDTPQDHSDAVLEDYTLNPLHRDNRSKARVFESVLGITLAKADVLRYALLDAAANSDQVEPRGDNGFGKVYVLRFRLTTMRGTAAVLRTRARITWSILVVRASGLPSTRQAGRLPHHMRTINLFPRGYLVPAHG